MQQASSRSIDEIRRCISAVWSAVLHRDDIDPTANFFDLGGTSLKMIRVHATLQSALDLKLPIVDLFAHPTLDGLAAHISAPAATRAAAEVVLPELLTNAPNVAGAGPKPFRSFRRQTP